MAWKLFSSRRLWLVAAGCVFLAAAAAAVLVWERLDEGERLYLSFGGRNYILKRGDATLIDKYTAQDDPTTFFWSDGKRAFLAIGGRERPQHVLLRGLEDDNDEEFLLTVDGENYRMKQVISASGAKYEAVDDPTTVFWSKGALAFLTVKGKDYSGYETWSPNNVIWTMEPEP
jgi:membrane-bound inhibitor of C-type lysozyme